MILDISYPFKCVASCIVSGKLSPLVSGSRRYSDPATIRQYYHRLIRQGGMAAVKVSSRVNRSLMKYATKTVS